MIILIFIPEGSRILKLAEMKNYLVGFDAEKLRYNWKSVDPLANDLQSKYTKQCNTASGTAPPDWLSLSRSGFWQMKLANI